MMITMIASPLSPRPLTISNTITASPAEGPLIWIGLPANEPMIMPPTMAVTSPSTGGTPEAIAIPIDNGTLIKTTTIAGKIFPRQPAFPLIKINPLWS